MKRKAFALLLLGFIAAGAYADIEGVFGYRVGSFEVYMIVAAERDGNTNIIPDADEATLRRLIPETGFSHSTNVFLIITPDRKILIDTAFGGVIYDRMRELGVETDQIDTVLLTHLHGDHIGGLHAEGRPLFPNAKIYLNAIELEYFTRTAVNEGAVAALNAYGSNVVSFDALPPGLVFKEVLPGIRAIANYGHTPGHTVYMVASGSSRLIIAGDFLHVALVQFPLPDISASFDMDQRAAAASRRQILDFAARNRIPIGGMHIVYPGIGNVEADGNGYRLVPAR